MACADRSAEAFALYRTFQAAISCALFFVTPVLSADGGKVATEAGLAIEIFIVAVNLMLALLGWGIFDCIAREEEEAEKGADSVTAPLLASESSGRVQ